MRSRTLELGVVASGQFPGRRMPFDATNESIPLQLMLQAR